MRTTDTHVYFWGSDLSNFAWAPFDIEIEGGFFHFKTTEQGFMFLKALEFGDVPAMEDILGTPDGKSVKAIGRRVRNFNEPKWSAVSRDRMLQVNLPKYRQNLRHRNVLLGTGRRTIVEASPTDMIWGVGLHETDDRILNEANWRGQNLLGEVLMDVRDILVQEPSDAEAAIGYVRPLRSTYIHVECGFETRLSLPDAKAYAQEPELFTKASCSECCRDFPVGRNGEFIWAESGGKVGV